MAAAEPAPAALVRVDPDGTASVAAEDLLFPNGSVITPDGGTLIVGETFGGRYTAFTIEADGSLSDRRIWARSAPRPPLGPFAEMLPQSTFAPDGCTLDAEGHIWSADGSTGAAAGSPRRRDRRRDRAARRASASSPAARRRRRPHAAVCAAPDFFEARGAAREAVLLTTTVEVPHAGLAVTTLYCADDRFQVVVALALVVLAVPAAALASGGMWPAERRSPRVRSFAPT